MATIDDLILHRANTEASNLCAEANSRILDVLKDTLLPMNANAYYSALPNAQKAVSAEQRRIAEVVAARMRGELMAKVFDRKDGV